MYTTKYDHDLIKDLNNMTNTKVPMNEKKKRGFPLKKYFSIVFIIFTIFLILKLTNKLNWQWIWVLSPLWIGIIFAIFFTSFALLVWMFLYKMMTGKNPFR